MTESQTTFTGEQLTPTDFLTKLPELEKQVFNGQKIQLGKMVDGWITGLSSPGKEPEKQKVDQQLEKLQQQFQGKNIKPEVLQRLAMIEALKSHLHLEKEQKIQSPFNDKIESVFSEAGVIDELRILQLLTVLEADEVKTYNSSVEEENAKLISIVSPNIKPEKDERRRENVRAVESDLEGRKHLEKLEGENGRTKITAEHRFDPEYRSDYQIYATLKRSLMLPDYLIALKAVEQGSKIDLNNAKKRLGLTDEEMMQFHSHSTHTELSQIFDQKMSRVMAAASKDQLKTDQDKLLYNRLFGFYDDQGQFTKGLLQEIVGHQDVSGKRDGYEGYVTDEKVMIFQGDEATHKEVFDSLGVAEDVRKEILKGIKTDDKTRLISTKLRMGMQAGEERHGTGKRLVVKHFESGELVLRAYKILDNILYRGQLRSEPLPTPKPELWDKIEIDLKVPTAIRLTQPEVKKSEGEGVVLTPSQSSTTEVQKTEEAVTSINLPPEPIVVSDEAIDKLIQSLPPEDQALVRGLDLTGLTERQIRKLPVLIRGSRDEEKEKIVEQMIKKARERRQTRLLQSMPEADRKLIEDFDLSELTDHEIKELPDLLRGKKVDGSINDSVKKMIEKSKIRRKESISPPLSPPVIEVPPITPSEVPPIEKIPSTEKVIQAEIITPSVVTSAVSPLKPVVEPPIASEKVTETAVEVAKPPKTSLQITQSIITSAQLTDELLYSLSDREVGQLIKDYYDEKIFNNIKERIGKALGKLLVANLPEYQVEKMMIKRYPQADLLRQNIIDTIIKHYERRIGASLVTEYLVFFEGFAKIMDANNKIITATKHMDCHVCIDQNKQLADLIKLLSIFDIYILENKITGFANAYKEWGRLASNLMAGPIRESSPSVERPTPLASLKAPSPSSSEPTLTLPSKSQWDTFIELNTEASPKEKKGIRKLIDRFRRKTPESPPQSLSRKDNGSV